MFLPNQQIFLCYIVFPHWQNVYAGRMKWLRGPDEMASRAGFGPWAVVW